MITNWFEGVSSVQRLQLCLVVLGLIWAVFYAMVWQPTTNEIESLRANVMYLEQEIERRKSHVSELDKTRRNDVSQQLMQDVLVASSRQTIRPRKDVMEIAESFGLPLTFWMPHRGENGSGILENQLLATRGRIEGGYHQIAKCLATILQLPWVAELNHIRLSVSNMGRKGGFVLAADFQLLGLVPSPLHNSNHVIQN